MDVISISSTSVMSERESETMSNGKINDKRKRFEEEQAQNHVARYSPQKKIPQKNHVVRYSPQKKIRQLSPTGQFVELTIERIYDNNMTLSSRLDYATKLWTTTREISVTEMLDYLRQTPGSIARLMSVVWNIGYFPLQQMCFMALAAFLGRVQLRDAVRYTTVMQDIRSCIAEKDLKLFDALPFSEAINWIDSRTARQHVMDINRMTGLCRTFRVLRCWASPDSKSELTRLRIEEWFDIGRGTSSFYWEDNQNVVVVNIPFSCIEEIDVDEVNDVLYLRTKRLDNLGGVRLLAFAIGQNDFWEFVSAVREMRNITCSDLITDVEQPIKLQSEGRTVERKGGNHFDISKESEPICDFVASYSMAVTDVDSPTNSSDTASINDFAFARVQPISSPEKNISKMDLLVKPASNAPHLIQTFVETENAVLGIDDKRNQTRLPQENQYEATDDHFAPKRHKMQPLDFETNRGSISKQNDSPDVCYQGNLHSRTIIPSAECAGHISSEVPPNNQIECMADEFEEVEDELRYIASETAYNFIQQTNDATMQINEQIDKSRTSITNSFARLSAQHLQHNHDLEKQEYNIREASDELQQIHHLHLPHAEYIVETKLTRVNRICNDRANEALDHLTENLQQLDQPKSIFVSIAVVVTVMIIVSWILFLIFYGVSNSNWHSYVLQTIEFVREVRMRILG